MNKYSCYLLSMMITNAWPINGSQVT